MTTKERKENLEHKNRCFKTIIVTLLGLIILPVVLLLMSIQPVQSQTIIPKTQQKIFKKTAKKPTPVTEEEIAAKTIISDTPLPLAPNEQTAIVPQTRLVLPDYYIIRSSTLTLICSFLAIYALATCGLAALCAAIMNRRWWVWFLIALFLTPLVALIALIILFFTRGQPIWTHEITQSAQLRYGALKHAKKRQIVLGIGVGMVVLACLFPPFWHRGYNFIFSRYGSIDLTRLAVEILIIISLTAYALYSMKKTDGE